MNKHYEKWDEYAPRGLLLIGFGIAILVRAVHSRNRNKGFFAWFIQFLISVVSINAGVSIFGEAVKERTLYEIEVRELRKQGQPEQETVTN